MSTLIIQWLVLQSNRSFCQSLRLHRYPFSATFVDPLSPQSMPIFGKLGHECIHHIYEYSKVIQFAIRQSRQQHQWEVIGSAFETQWKHLRKYTSYHTYKEKDNQIWIQLRNHKTNHCDPYNGP